MLPASGPWYSRVTLGNGRTLWLVSVALLLPVPLAIAGARRLADRTGERLGARLVQWADMSSPGPQPVKISPNFDGGATIGDLGVPRPVDLPKNERSAREGDLPALRDRRSTSGGSARVDAPHRGVRIPAATVLRVANSGARPTGIPVPAEGSRPAGLMLSGVSALGVGIQDGDVLTHAAGRPALSESDVISMVIAARGQEVPVIGGQFWRNGEPWNLVVEQPYVREDGTSLRRTRGKRPTGTSQGATASGAGAASRERTGDPPVPDSQFK